MRDKSTKENWILVDLLWHDEYIEQGGLTPTHEKFHKEDFNPDEPSNQSWHKDLWLQYDIK